MPMDASTNFHDTKKKVITFTPTVTELLGGLNALITHIFWPKLKEVVSLILMGGLVSL